MDLRSAGSGSFAAAERSAVVLSIIETCKLCGVDAEAYMADVIDRLAKGHPINRLAELLPWNWKAARNPSQAQQRAA